jgi:hypothetical protein
VRPNPKKLPGVPTPHRRQTGACNSGLPKILWTIALYVIHSSTAKEFEDDGFIPDRHTAYIKGSLDEKADLTM